MEKGRVKLVTWKAVCPPGLSSQPDPLGRRRPFQPNQTHWAPRRLNPSRPGQCRRPQPNQAHWVPLPSIS